MATEKYEIISETIGGTMGMPHGLINNPPSQTPIYRFRLPVKGGIMKKYGVIYVRTVTEKLKKEILDRFHSPKFDYLEKI